jgi:NAD(P)-dependent dehydrogenase (short-subunit alcohol dehydrogenase family)
MGTAVSLMIAVAMAVRVSPNHQSHFMKVSFAGKVVLITGGTSGIGRATAVAFAEQGANVVVAGRRQTEGVESVRLVEKAGGKGLFVRTDVSAEEEIAALVARTVEHFGRLDFAFNNAGIGGEGGVGIANTGEVFDRIIDINVRGVFFGMKHQIPAILKSGGGAIVNNASILGLKPVAGSPIYSASKFAVVGLTKSVALEFAAKGVRVNAVCPAIIETDMTEQIRTSDETRGYLLQRHPIGRFGQPAEVASAVLYLCSPGAAFVTGIALPLDGGFIA